MKKIIYTNKEIAKTAKLKKVNWTKVQEGSEYIIYAHKKRKYLTINYNKKTQLMYFKDQKKGKIISKIMTLKWI